MSKPRVHVLALGGTIATRPDASGVMQMGAGADDLVAAVPLLAGLADIQAETVSRVGSHSLSFDQIHALGAGEVDGFAELEDAKLLAIRRYDSHFPGADFSSDPDERTGGGRRTRGERATQDTLNG